VKHAPAIMDTQKEIQQSIDLLSVQASVPFREKCTQSL